MPYTYTARCRAHGISPGFRRFILLVRNPFDAIWSVSPYTNSIDLLYQKATNLIRAPHFIHTALLSDGLKHRSDYRRKFKTPVVLQDDFDKKGFTMAALKYSRTYVGLEHGDPRSTKSR